MHFVRKTNEEFLQELKDKDIIYIPLEEYKGSSIKIKWHCPKCCNEFYASPNNILSGRGCSYCRKSAKSILIGFNDMWTTNPQLASMLANQEDGYKYAQNSHKSTDWVCPICNNIVYGKTISSVNRYGLSCSSCSDGVSYPEKLISNMLKQLNIKFIHDEPLSWSNGKRYDFYIEEMSLIIESHGGQHYEDGFITVGGKSVKEQQNIDIYKKNLALENNIEKYIQLDCRISELEFIKKSIIDSDLALIFDLSSIDWEKCHKDSISSSRVIEACKLWNKTENTKLISDKLCISRTTVIEYLNKGNGLGLCNYNARKNMSKTNSKSAICIETGKIYSPIKTVKEDEFSPECVSNCCRGIQQHHKGFHFEYYNKGVS